MQIGGLQKFTLIDYPGHLACTLFLSGCNFHCPWCYARELVLPEKIKKQPKIPEEEFFDFLKERKNLLEGVVLCGGEPTINKDLPELIKKIKERKYLIKLDTNGSNPKMLKKLIGENLIDYVAMDIKAPLEEKKYQKATGVKTDLVKIKESIKIIKNSGLDYEFRTTVVPTIHQKEDILQIARTISPAKKYYLQGFRPGKNISPKFEKTKPYTQEYLLEIQKAVAPFFEICQLR